MAAAGAAGSRSRPWRASRSPRERSGKLPESGDLHSTYTGHAAACHACLFASETSCETNNRWLDRAVLADLTRDGLAFPL